MHRRERKGRKDWLGWERARNRWVNGLTQPINQCQAQITWMNHIRLYDTHPSSFLLPISLPSSTDSSALVAVLNETVSVTSFIGDFLALNIVLSKVWWAALLGLLCCRLASVNTVAWAGKSRRTNRYVSRSGLVLLLYRGRVQWP